MVICISTFLFKYKNNACFLVQEYLRLQSLTDYETDDEVFEGEAAAGQNLLSTNSHQSVSDSQYVSQSSEQAGSQCSVINDH